MILLELLVFSFATVGMSHIIVDGSIFNPFKTWLEKGGWLKGKLLSLMNCYQCSGFWSGVFVGLNMWLLGADPVHNIFALFLYGCMGGLLSPSVAIVIMWIQSNSKE